MHPVNGGGRGDPWTIYVSVAEPSSTPVWHHILSEFFVKRIKRVDYTLRPRDRQAIAHTDRHFSRNFRLIVPQELTGQGADQADPFQDAEWQAPNN
jgi:hypothetical protein